MTSVALLMLYEDALCHLDTPVDEFLPEFADPQVMVPSATSVDQIHVRGPANPPPSANPHIKAYLQLQRRATCAGDGRPEAGFRQQAGGSGDDQEAGDLPLAFEPGTRWNYGVSTDVIGRVVEDLRHAARPLLSGAYPRSIGHDGHRLRRRRTSRAALPPAM